MWVKREKDSDLKITDERKRVENENVLVKHLVDENVNYDSVSSFNADITNRNQGEDLDESIQTNEDNKHNKFRENPSEKNPRVNLTAGDLNDLSHNKMLNNNIIQTFQQMLKFQYPDANGLQDPVLDQALNLLFIKPVNSSRCCLTEVYTGLLLVLTNAYKGSFLNG